MAKVSFIIPAFKRKFLAATISSILSQTYRDFELVVVDDCSPEDIKSIVDGFNDKRLSYYRNKSNIGGQSLVAAWNHALEFAHGEWCIMAGDDDVYLPRYLEEMLRLIEKYPKCDIVHGRIAVIDSEGQWSYVAEERCEFETQIQMAYSRAVRRNLQVLPDFMFRISKLKAIGGFVNTPLAWCSDDATWIALSKNGVACSSEVLFLFRNSGLNISSRTDNVIAKIDSVEKYRRWLSEQYKFFIPTSIEDEFLLSRLPNGVNHALDKEVCRLMWDVSLFRWIGVIHEQRFKKKTLVRLLIERMLLIRHIVRLRQKLLA